MDSVLLESIGDYWADCGDYRFSKRLGNHLRGCDGKKALDLWGAGEGDGVDFPCLQPPEKIEHRRVIGGIGINLRRYRRYFRAGGFEEFDQWAVGLGPVELHAEAASLQILTAKAGNHAVSRWPLGGNVRFQSQLT